MKGHRIRFLSVIATFMLISSILSSQALAVARSSKYLDAYGTYVSPVGNGKIVIKYRYCPEFQNDYGEPISSNIAQILFDKNFSTLAVQLEGIDGDSRFLVLNASNREDALSQYAYLLDAKELKF